MPHYLNHTSVVVDVTEPCWRYLRTRLLTWSIHRESEHPAFSAMRYSFVITGSPLLRAAGVSSHHATMCSFLSSSSITRLHRYYKAIRLPVPYCRDRNTVRAVLSGEFPIHAPFRYVQWVPNSTMTHVSASPPFIPEGRISRVRLAATAFPREPFRKI